MISAHENHDAISGSLFIFFTAERVPEIRLFVSHHVQNSQNVGEKDEFL